MVKRILLMAALLTTALAAENRIYEMRTYTTLNGKLDALLARFRNHTVALFEKHGMTNIGYWIPKDKPNTLIYVLAYKDMAAAKAAWEAFRNDPDWVKARTESEAAGKIVEKVESVYMDPADFSKLK